MESPLEPFFTRAGDAFAPSRAALGPWGETINGRLVGGLAGRALEAAHGAEGFQPARLTVDMFRPAAMTPLTMQTAGVREGRRIRVADASLAQNGVEVARATMVFLLRTEQPPGEVWSAPRPAGGPPERPADTPPDAPMAMWRESDGDATAPASPLPGWSGAGRKSVWIRENRALVAGEELTPFVRAALVGDITSPLTGWGTAGLQFINVDYTLVLTRLPDGEDIGLAATDHQSTDGVAVGTAVMRDRHGPIGSCAITALANPNGGFRIPRAPRA